MNFDVKTNKALYVDAMLILLETEEKLKQLKELIRVFRDITEEEK